MKKMIFRVLAYAVDMVLVSAITIFLATLSFVNPGYNEYKTQYESLNEVRIIYTNFGTEYNKSIEDNKISAEEKTKLDELSTEYSVVLNDYVDKDLSDEDKSKITTEIQNKFNDKYNDIAYSMTKNNSITKIITILMTIFYFGVIQYVLKGRTIGKLVFRLRVVNKDDNNKPVPLYSYLLRSIIIGELLIIAADLITLYALNKDGYLVSAGIINTVQYIYEIAFLIVMMMREDQRSIHDLLLGTRVALFDKEGNEVIETSTEEEVKEEPKKEEKKATPKKKTTTKKKTTKKKEFVSAEKVDD